MFPNDYNFEYGYEQEEFEYKRPSVKSKNSQLPYPNYQDDYYKIERTVYGKEQKGLEYNYQDRLWDWDYQKAKNASDIANNSGKTNRSCAWFEKFLSAYFDKDIEIKHIMACFNVATGYPIYLFGYKVK